MPSSSERGLRRVGGVGEGGGRVPRLPLGGEGAQRTVSLFGEVKQKGRHSLPQF